MKVTINITAEECKLHCTCVHNVIFHRPNCFLYRDRLSRFEGFCILRERSMVHELGQTFFITETADMFAICNVILPNADQHDRK